ncbi:NADP-dependent malic enzyme isoform X1 [Drosophila teissieri]|uniref:NADP-dependent malic enzyme isoform X1 n=2 Tax=Drosophila teissieri TaxID=7243 RepID=UPI001CBA40BA|nr:NADP-dependent malic enzyme isoform X1 [Drosophila teissieri]
MEFRRLQPLLRLPSRPLLSFCRQISVYDDEMDQIMRPSWHVVMNGKYNKGLAFTVNERQRLGIMGLMPCSVRTMDDQMKAAHANFDARPSDIGRFTYLSALHNRHRRLYYRFIKENIERALPIVYTPTVGDVVSTYGLNFQQAISLFISIHDKGHIRDLMHNWVDEGVKAICVTDGGRVLGLGDMGANAMGISLGKMILYTALGSIPPSTLMPVCLDVGTDNQALLQDPLYVGARIPRVTGPEYEELVDEFMESAVKCFGHSVFIHFEDFATPNALKFLDKYQRKYCCFNDDIQGTGATGLAAFINVERITGRKLEDTTFLFVGAGSAALGIANMLAMELEVRGLPLEEATKNIYLMDLNGVLTHESPNPPEMGKIFMKRMEPMKDLMAVLEKFKPSVLVGATGVAGIFNEEVLKTMAKNHERPAVFPLSNPTSNSECTAEQAFTHTEGRVLFGSGSPFPPVVINGKRYVPAQANNCLTFPGIALAAITAKARYLPNAVFSVVSHELARNTPQELLDEGTLFPPIKDANSVAFNVGVAMSQYLFDNGLSAIYPQPDDVCEFVKSRLYKFEYRNSLPTTWKYPEEPAAPKAKFKPRPQKKATE